MKKIILAVLVALCFTASAAQAEKFGSFTTTALDGTAVNESILSGHMITMFNVWGTYCPPCLQEMPFLGRLAAEMEDDGVQIIGVLCDWFDKNGELSEAQLAKARTLIQKTGADYTHVILSDELLARTGRFSAIPFTFFLDSEGEILAAYMGARSEDGWREIIETLLLKVAHEK